MKTRFVFLCIPMLTLALVACEKKAVSADQQSNSAQQSSSTSNESAANQIEQTIDQLLGDHETYLGVFNQLKAATAANDAAAVAAIVAYPINLDIDGHNQLIKNVEEFTSIYADFMSPAMQKAITSTNWADVFVNDQGIMLGDGEAWINGICSDSTCQESSVKVVQLQSTQ